MIDMSRNPRVRRAAAMLAAGGVVAYPTEAVWGLGVDPANPQAVQRLLALKGRPRHKGLILLAANTEQLAPWLLGLSAEQQQRLADTWPGPVTWLLPNRGIASPWVTGDFTSVALRVTDHPLAGALCRAFGG
ncbi:MAG TPA: Sua5/YciO/YrdC/YwlC family protein, partial [Cellvibrionaceae bacterium]